MTIRGGVVQEFDYGVTLNPGATLNIVSDLLLRANQEAAIQLVDADGGATGNIVRANNLLENEGGILLTGGTSNATIRENAISATAGNAIYLLGANGNHILANAITGSSGAAIALADSDGNTIVGNSADANTEGIVLGEPDLPSNNNLVEGNVVTAASSAGILVVESIGNDIVGNEVNGSGGGIALEFSSSTLIHGNDLRFNAGGIELQDSSDNQIVLNNASGSSGAGISLEGLSLNNDLLMNSVNNNNGEGIYVGGVAASSARNLIQSPLPTSIPLRHPMRGRLSRCRPTQPLRRRTSSLVPAEQSHRQASFSSSPGMTTARQ